MFARTTALFRREKKSKKHKEEEIIPLKIKQREKNKKMGKIFSISLKKIMDDLFKRECIILCKG